MPSSHRPDRLAVAFDDDHAVANAGLVLPALLAQRLGVQQLADELIDLGERPGAAHPGSKLMTLVHSLLAGGDCIDDAVRPAAFRLDGGGAGPPGAGALNPGDVPARVHLRACPSAGPAGRTGPHPGLGGR
jgi:hypothetical protein